MYDIKIDNIFIGNENDYRGSQTVLKKKRKKNWRSNT